MVKLINNIVKYNILFLMLMFLNSCCDSWLYPDDELSFKRIDYTGNQLKISGYYYTIFRANTQDKDQVLICFLNRNGIIHSAGLYYRKDSLTFESMFKEPSYQITEKEWMTAWGAFKIEDNKIQFETWGPGEGSKPAFNYSGDILNDTTFHITKLTRASGSFIRALDDTYHLKRFSPKPDSTNKFVK